MAISIMDTKYISCLWMKNFIDGLRIVDSVSRPLRIFYDNSTTVFMGKNNKW